VGLHYPPGGGRCIVGLFGAGRKLVLGTASVSCDDLPRMPFGLRFGATAGPYLPPGPRAKLRRTALAR
jgi:hypothetical protein